MKSIYKNLEVQYQKLFRHLKGGSFKTRERYGKGFKKFWVFLAKEFRLQKLSIVSGNHIVAYAHEKYEHYINKGFSEFVARKKVSEQLGHHRDDVTRIYLAE